MLELQLIMFIPALLGLVIPYITEWVLASNADPIIKSILNIALSLLLGVIATVPIAGGVAGLLPYAVNVLTAWVLSGRMYVAELVKGRTPGTGQDQL